MGSQCVAVRCVCCSVLSEIYIGLVTYEDESHVNRVETLALIFVPDTGGEPVCCSHSVCCSVLLACSTTTINLSLVTNTYTCTTCTRTNGSCHADELDLSRIQINRVASENRTNC